MKHHRANLKAKIEILEPVRLAMIDVPQILISQGTLIFLNEVLAKDYNPAIVQRWMVR